MPTTGLRQFARARARRRAERETSRRHCEKLLADLPPIAPGSMHQLCAAVRTPDGRPIRVHQMLIPPHGPAALLAPFDDEDVIIVDREAGRFSRWRAMAHEMAHSVLGHCVAKDCMSDADQRALWFPDLDPEFVERALAFTPGHFPTQEERDADALAGRLLAVVLHGMADEQAYGAPGAEAVPLLGRRDALYRQFWQLRPLWVTLVTAVPGAALYPPASALVDLTRVRDLEDRVIRQVIEILDVRRLLQDWKEPAVGAMARDLAHRDGLAGTTADATAEAAMLAAAAREVPRDMPLTAGGVACAARVDVHAEVTWLQLVAAAFRGPIVRATLTEYFG